MTNTPQTPPEPLDETERSLARALRNLPAGSPSPELDKLILSAARRAVQIPPARRDRRWIIGLSSAATALLAMGVLLKMHGLGRDAVLAPPSSEEAAPALDKVPPTATADHWPPQPPKVETASPAAATTAFNPMEAGKDEAQQSAAGGPAAAPVAADMNAKAPASRGEAEQVRTPPPMEVPPPAKQIPQAFPSSATAPPKTLPPPPPRPPVIVSTPSLMSTPAPPPAPAAAAPAAAQAPAMKDERKEAVTEADTAARRDAETRQTSNAVEAYGVLSGVSSQEQAAKKAAPTGGLQANEPAPQRSLDKLELDSARLKAATPALPPLADDAKLSVADWIARIRARLHSGDHAGATSSLKAFVHAHPDATIPDDLQPLLH
jgi:hypothetical protein